MLPPGDYKIQNLLYDTKFVHMRTDDVVVGFEEADIVELIVINAGLGLATLFDKLRYKYIVIDKETGDVVGSAEPQVLQFSTEDGEKYIIHIMDVNEVWVLNKGKDGNPIITTPAPPPSVKDYEKKYWLFARLF